MYDPNVISDDELLARFAFDSGYYRNNGTAKPRAFVPDAEDQVSIFRLDGLAPMQTWVLGDAAGAMRGKPARAQIRIRAGHVHNPLFVQIDEPPARHAVIEGWPDEHLRLQLQQELAEQAEVCVRPDA